MEIAAIKESAPIEETLPIDEVAPTEKATNEDPKIVVFVEEAINVQV